MNGTVSDIPPVSYTHLFSTRMSTTPCISCSLMSLPALLVNSVHLSLIHICAVSAGCAAGAGIAFLMHENDTVIKHVIVNCLAITSGIICDGAKPSCAAKIASSVDAALLALAMAQHKQQFRAGEGIVKKGVENTICSVGRLGKNGMRETDKEILRITRFPAWTGNRPRPAPA